MRKMVLSQKEIDEIIILYDEEKLSTHTILLKTGINRRTVLRVLKDNNIPLRNSGQQYNGGVKEANKRYHKKNKEKVLKYHTEWSEKNRQHLREYHAKWREKNKQHLRETRNTYEHNRKHNDPMYKLVANFRTAIYTVLKENNLSKNGHYFDILGYTAEDLKQHLDALLTDGMTWENYGEWHIDHIIPITSFNFTSVYDEEFKKCWSLGNLQPMWGPDNIRKSNRIT